MVGYLTVSALFAANGLGDVNRWLDVLSGFGVELQLFAIGLKMKPKSILPSRRRIRYPPASDVVCPDFGACCNAGFVDEMKIALALTLGFSSKVVAVKGLTNTLGYSRVTTDCVLLSGWDASPARSVGSD